MKEERKHYLENIVRLPEREICAKIIKTPL